MNNKCSLVYFIIAFVYALAGISGFFVFIIFKNYPSAVLAITTGIINVILAYISLLFYKNKIQEWYSAKNLRQIGSFGFYSFTISTSILIYFTVTEILEKKPILPVNNSVIIPIIWAFITLKSGLLLLCIARSYGNSINNGNQSLVPRQERPNNEPVEEEEEVMNAETA